jgi:hypothetical protein
VPLAPRLSALAEAGWNTFQLRSRDVFIPLADRAAVGNRYRNALFHLMSSQTSCFRYWGQGLWTDYGREICRRTGEILRNDFG